MTIKPYGYVPLLEAIAKCQEAKKLDAVNSYEFLRSLLHAGEIEGVTVDAGGQTKQRWTEWGATLNDKAYQTGQLMIESDRLDGPYVLAAFVHEAELKANFSSASDAEKPTPTIAKPTRGAKVGHDDFWIEACRLIFTAEWSPDEKTQADLTESLMNWIGVHKPGLYAESTVEDKVNALWRVLKPRG